MTAVAKVPVWVSVDEFLAWEPGDHQRWQLVNGEPHAMAPANRTRGTLQNRLSRVIDEHLERIGSPCVAVANSGVIPNVLASHNFRVPDLAVTCSDYQAEESALTDPVLIVEVLSVSNRAETWANVWSYTSIPSVRDILVLHTVSIGAELLTRQADGGWPADPVLVTDGTLTLSSIGLSVPLRDLYVRTRLRLPG